VFTRNNCKPVVQAPKRMPVGKITDGCFIHP
jgi:hypothetical protein